MTTTAIYDEFAALVGAFAAGIGLQVAYPGIHFDPPSEGDWLELAAFWNGSDPYGMADDGPNIEQGFFRIMACSRGAGLMGVQELAEKIMAAFPKGITFGNARTERTPVMSGPIQGDDKLVIPVTIRWRATR